MSTIRQVPELADGGYWSVVPVLTEDGLSADTGVPAWCAQYGEVGGVMYAVIRTTQPALPIDGVTPQQVIAAAFSSGSLPSPGKFHARLGGR